MEKFDLRYSKRVCDKLRIIQVCLKIENIQYQIAT